MSGDMNISTCLTLRPYRISHAGRYQLQKGLNNPHPPFPAGAVRLTKQVRHSRTFRLPRRLDSAGLNRKPDAPTPPRLQVDLHRTMRHGLCSVTPLLRCPHIPTHPHLEPRVGTHSPRLAPSRCQPFFMRGVCTSVTTPLTLGGSRV